MKAIITRAFKVEISLKPKELLQLLELTYRHDKALYSEFKKAPVSRNTLANELTYKGFSVATFDNLRACVENNNAGLYRLLDWKVYQYTKH